jgi:peroxiredoxin
MQDKPFALIGVNINCHDPKALKEVMDKERLTFRSFTDKADGEGLGVIGSAWNLFGTPTVFVLDHKGVIRYRQMGIPDKKAIDGVLKELIREAETNDKKEKETDG